ncbi:FAD-binding oxidoreductase [Anaerolineales bacterium]
MTVSIWQANHLNQTIETDFLVVGAGINGACAAYFASQMGLDVCIIDKHTSASGASGRNAGFMITGLDSYYHQAIETYGRAVSLEMWELSLHTISLWKTFIENSPIPIQYENCGSMLLAENEAEAEQLRLAARELEKDSIPIIFHDQDPLNRGYHAAIEQPDDAAIQPVQLTQSILAQGRSTYFPNHEVYQIQQQASGEVMVHTNQTLFKARYVLLCVNAYAPLIHPYFEGLVLPTRAQVMVTEVLKERPIPVLGYSDYGYMYYRTTFDNRLLIGGARHLFRDQEANTTEDRLNPAVQNALDQYLLKRFPELEACKIERRWSGIMGFSVDGLPLVGTLPDMPNVGFALGFTGHGLALGAGTVERAVDHLLTGADAGAVSASRLG